MNKFRWLIALASLLVTLTCWSAIEVYHFDSPEQEKTFKSISNELRCPKCQNNTIADSNAQLAHDIRNKVYVMLQDGKSQDDIIDYMKARYGNFIVYSPPFNWTTAILWIAPIMVVLFGAIAVYSRSSKTSHSSTHHRESYEQLTKEEQARLDKILADDPNDNQRGA
ncbi:cytochrome c-type biogenesis protein [Vibrio viridaestus]|uniref:Cytochrome c-type biogenesis protein n=1 Tax=Vibrio viridaestus TaxID=2487322 RepID=A0A3N9TJ47_9VIBR|nr:cytochrome c-type biogenesis protein [Vibrio viridaestus]RQW64170.1 cytochrome c-type biogenesis protein CcmH [Vibrio viridaestus]